MIFKKLQRKIIAGVILILACLVWQPVFAQIPPEPEIPEGATDHQRAMIYLDYGHKLLGTDSDIATIHNYYYRAIDIFRSEGDYINEVRSLYHLAITYLDLRDTDNLERIVGDMRRAAEKLPHPEILYKLYAVVVAHWSTLALETDYQNRAYNDSTMVYMHKTIDLIECCRAELDPNLSPGWQYYNMATCYFNFYSDRNDSVIVYLDKALAEKELITDEGIATELEISVYGQLAEMHLRDREYRKAEEKLLYKLSLLEPMKGNNTVVVDFAEAYAMMVDLYEQTDRPAEALKYQKLLQEVEQLRYNEDKLVAINDMAAKYQHEKQQTEITALVKEKRNVQIISWLLGIVALLLAGGIYVIFRLNRMRHKNIKLELYETALLAEQKQSELESIKQGLRGEPFAMVKEQLLQLIETSALAQEVKRHYKEKLLGFDTTALDKSMVASDVTFSAMDVRYLLCFAIDMKTTDIATMFNIEPASVNTVRYRIRKKAGKNSGLLV
jgi:hypothetical protein